MKKTINLLVNCSYLSSDMTMSSKFSKKLYKNICNSAWSWTI